MCKETKIVAGILAVLLVISAVSAIAGHLTNKTNSATIDDLNMQIVKLENLEPETIVEEVEVLVENPETLERVKELEAIFELHKDAIEQDKLENGALELSVLELEDKDFLIQLQSYLNFVGWNVEYYKDILSVTVLEELSVDVEDDEGISGTVELELIVLFLDNGLDGNRHREFVDVTFEFEEGEIVDYY